MAWKLIGQSNSQDQPSPAVTTSTKTPRRTGPVEDWEIDPEAMEELLRLVEREKRGEVKWIPHEDLMRELGFDDDASPGD